MKEDLLPPVGARGLQEAWEDFVRGELDFERVAAALREQVRLHPGRTLAIAALGGFLLSKLMRRS